MTTPNQTLSRYLGADRRNRIVNGAMQHSQENGNAAGTTLNYYASDQWFLLTVGGAVSLQRVQSTTPGGASDRLRLSVTTAKGTLANGDVLGIRHFIEGMQVPDFLWGTANARQVILRFGVRAPAGTYLVAIRNNAVNRSYLATFTIAAGESNTDVVRSFAIPGDTAGVWPTDNGRAILMEVMFASQQSANGSVGSWLAGSFIGAPGLTNGLASTANVFELFDVGLYLDPLNTGIAPRWELPDFGEELRRCQRYYQPVTLSAAAHATSTLGVSQVLPVVMRSGPSITTLATGVYWGNSNVTGNGNPSADSVYVHLWYAIIAAQHTQFSNRIALNARM